ncbi:MAG TPA: hypothetical protein VF790_05135 [Dissulfurispiraceae bacterium]
MASSAKKKPYGSLIIMGAISVALYSFLLMQQDMINGYIGRGGMYAFLPILTAFLFSFVHGSFTGNFWTVLGIEAAKKRIGVPGKSADFSGSR